VVPVFVFAAKPLRKHYCAAKNGPEAMSRGKIAPEATFRVLKEYFCISTACGSKNNKKRGLVPQGQ